MKLFLGHQSISQYTSDKQEFVKNYVNVKSHNKGKYNKHMAFGDSLHITLARFNNIQNEQEKTPEVLEKYLNDSWISFNYETKEEEKQYFDRALNILRKYYQNPKDKARKILLVEEMLTKELASDAVLFGRVDKIFINEFGQLEVLDYKTSNYVKRNLNILEDSQLSLYLILAKQRLGYYAQVISYYYLPRNIKVSYFVKQEDIARVEKHIDKIIESIKKDCSAAKGIS